MLTLYLKQLFRKDDLVDMIGNSSQVDLLSKLLQQSEQKQKVVSQNIANVNTPGYKSLDAKFVDALESASKSDKSGNGKLLLVQTSGLVEREDGNNVNLDKEMGDLTKNAIEFETFTNLLVAKFSLLRSAITGQ